MFIVCSHLAVNAKPRSKWDARNLRLKINPQQPAGRFWQNEPNLLISERESLCAGIPRGSPRFVIGALSAAATAHRMAQ
jgi:hypothetical protein